MMPAPMPDDSLLVLAVGDCHGRLSDLYYSALALEDERLGGRPLDLLVQVGDLGVWPDPARLDRATQKHGETGDFARWASEQRAAPRPTLFVAGNHEDFDYLVQHGANPLVPGLTFLPWGAVTTFAARGRVLRIGGLGGCYGASDYPRGALHGRRRRHYTRAEIDRLIAQAQPPIDILLLHDAPAGVLADPAQGAPTRRKHVSDSLGLDELITAVSPGICLTGHFHVGSDRQIAGVRTLGLSIYPRAGSFVLLEYAPGEAAPRVTPLAPRRPPAPPPDPALAALERLLTEWAARVRGTAPVDRRRRAQLHDWLADHPHRAVLLPALKRGDVRGALARHVPADGWGELLHRFETGGLPEPPG